MTRLIIPDIHQDVDAADRIIAAVPHDAVVFLGDYFDDFYDTPADAALAAWWLQQRMLQHPEDVFLAGNHDIPYLWNGLEICSGFTWDKHGAIASACDVNAVRSRLRLHTWVDGWLLTHAGLSRAFLPAKPSKVETFMSQLDQMVAQCLDNMAVGRSHSLIMPGTDRGGTQACGGITWCDYSRFRPLEGVKQLFGHTKGKFARAVGDNACIDTGLQHYAVITDGKMSVAETIKLWPRNSANRVSRS